MGIPISRPFCLNWTCDCPAAVNPSLDPGFIRGHHASWCHRINLAVTSPAHRIAQQELPQGVIARE